MIYDLMLVNITEDNLPLYKEKKQSGNIYYVQDDSGEFDCLFDSTIINKKELALILKDCYNIDINPLLDAQ